MTINLNDKLTESNESSESFRGTTVRDYYLNHSELHSLTRTQLSKKDYKLYEKMLETGDISLIPRDRYGAKKNGCPGVSQIQIDNLIYSWNETHNISYCLNVSEMCLTTARKYLKMAGEI